MQLRKLHRLDQHQLADRTGISQKTLSDYESGWANPTLYNLIRISNALNIELDRLITPRKEEIKAWTEAYLDKKP